MNIAVVDDEKNLRLAVSTALTKEGFSVSQFENGKLAFEQKDLNPDLYVLDIMMPVMDGISLLRALRESGNKTPVIFLTSKDDEFDKILGLELGADDYLCKPFSMRELITRIKVILRRTGSLQKQTQKEETLKAGEIIIFPESYTATKNGVPLSLTVTEFRLLQTFAENPDSALSREQLISAAYPEETYLNDRAIDCHIKRLRKKIGGEYIETVYGLGYRFKRNISK
ncbi:MAG: response regulator transcription factor [Treponema sp.]|nr:response regulator transcription factor [Treponema sp.]